MEVSKNGLVCREACDLKRRVNVSGKKVLFRDNFFVPFLGCPFQLDKAVLLVNVNVVDRMIVADYNPK